MVWPSGEPAGPSWFPPDRTGEGPAALRVPHARDRAIRRDLESEHVATVVVGRPVARVGGRVEGIDAGAQSERRDLQSDLPLAGELRGPKAVDVRVRAEDALA